MNIRSILTRGHWLRMPDGKYPLLFVIEQKDHIKVYYEDAGVIKQLDLIIINLKYDRVTEKYYIQYSSSAYIQFQLLKPGEQRGYRRTLETGFLNVTLQLHQKALTKHWAVSDIVDIRTILLKYALVTSTKKPSDYQLLDEIGNYYLGKAIYLSHEFSKGNEDPFPSLLELII